MSKHETGFKLKSPIKAPLCGTSRVAFKPPQKGVTIGTDGREHRQKRNRSSWAPARGELTPTNM